MTGFHGSLSKRQSPPNSPHSASPPRIEQDSGQVSNRRVVAVGRRLSPRTSRTRPIKQPAAAHIGSQHGSEPPPSTTYPGSRTTFQSRARSSNTRSRSDPTRSCSRPCMKPRSTTPFSTSIRKYPRIGDEPRRRQRTPIRMLDDALHQQRHAMRGTRGIRSHGMLRGPTSPPICLGVAPYGMHQPYDFAIDPIRTRHFASVPPRSLLSPSERRPWNCIRSAIFSRCATS